MTGLDSIISQIAGDGQKEAEEILAEARKQAGEIADNAKSEGAEKVRATLKDGERRAQDIRDRAQSAADLVQRNEMLVFKQALIREAVDAARDSLENAPDQAYFETLLTLYKRFAQEGRGEMRLNKKDIDRLPDDFLARMRKAVPEAEVTISPKPHKIESGFMLVYGGVDINCTFRAIFEDAWEELRDAAGRLLFPVA
ncbi:V-type ATP synthase subunit E [Acutalibacter caecimuris]|uniref:V-type ATP synthase subunit E n=1 Tax=Acutalibacter caecimuris TaxID=3093657 RepID=UPI002AC9EA9B|nr:V-type ATP synthase subunit E family protein [Acutalibacter sp. M00118]